MSDVPDLLNTFDTNEVDYRSAVSEQLLTKVAGVTNHIVNRINKSYDFRFLGPFHTILGGEDGTKSDIWPYEIVGISGYIRVSGTSGTSTIDIHRITGAGDQGSILSTKLQISFNAANGSRFYKNLINGAFQDIPTGWTAPIFTLTDLEAGDTLRVDIDSNAVSARDLTINIHYRARS